MVKERIRSDSVNFFDPLQKLKLQTFTTALKKKTVKALGQDVINRADRGLMSRMLVIAKSRDMDLQMLLNYELGPVPWSIAAVDGTLVKTVKSSSLALLEKDVPPAQHIPDGAAWMVDAMAVLQSLVSPKGSFADVAKLVFNITTAAFQMGAQRIDFVVDQYPQSVSKPVSETVVPSREY